MKFALVSDLHFEFHRDGGVTLSEELPDTDILVVAGDLSSAGCLWDALSLLLQKYKHVVFVYGNHEFYGSTLQAVRQKTKRLQSRAARDSSVGTLHILDNSTTTIEGQRFVGTTLWFRHEPGIESKHSFLTDFEAIRGPSSRLYEENERSIRFLTDTVTADDVVVTHHLPHPESIHPRWKGSIYNCFFMCDMSELISERQPKMWVHGHTHDSRSYRLGSTRVVCNPFGYAGHDLNDAFDPSLVLEV